MLQRLNVQGVELPRLYIAQNEVDVQIAKANGVPFVKWRGSQRALVVLLLWPVLEKMFPDVKWDLVFDRRLRNFRSRILVETGKIDVRPTIDDGKAKPAKEPSQAHGDDLPTDADGIIEEKVIMNAGTHSGYYHADDYGTHMLSLEEYAGDLSSSINIEVLQKMRLMPAFIGDIIDCIKVNLTSGIYWREGYNKKRGLPVGRYDSARQLPNLIILDVSRSIPRGISSTMLMLIDTLRSQVSADLIVTGLRSVFFPMGCDLPSPQELRKMVPLGQEGYEFMQIMREHVQGRHYGHVFSFGDGDTPAYYLGDERYPTVGTTVNAVHHYHTCAPNTPTGYAKWCDMLAQRPGLVEYDTSWCKVIKK